MKIRITIVLLGLVLGFVLNTQARSQIDKTIVASKQELLDKALKFYYAEEYDKAFLLLDQVKSTLISSEPEDVLAMFCLGEMYKNGYGIEADAIKAKYWYKRSIEGDQQIPGILIVLLVLPIFILLSFVIRENGESDQGRILFFGRP